MNKNIFLKGALGVMLIGGFAMGTVSCSDDYLDLEPVTQVDKHIVYTTVDGAKLGMRGICRSMYTQYSELENYRAMNGEPWCRALYGDVMGQDFFSYMWASAAAGNYSRWASMNNVSGWMPLLAWRYYYNIIGQCNTILSGIETASGDVQERDLVWAQVLTLRSHAYHCLLQMFAPRWADSNNGATMCIVDRRTDTTAPKPLMSMATTLKQIYDDLDKAIQLYKSCGKTREYGWEPMLNIAQGIYARAALLKDDFATAEKMAHDARQGFPIMSSEEFNAGFCRANGEWMWANYEDNIYYWAFGSWYACNGAYSTLMPWGAGAINYELYKQIPAGDIRAAQFWTPDKVSGGLSAANFWSEAYVDPSTMNLAKKNRQMRIALATYGESRVPDGNTTFWGRPYTAREEVEGAEGSIIPFGAHYKFWSLDSFGTGQFPYMRGAEMLLIEAEAAYHNGNTGVTTSCLKELNAQRNPNYTCDKSGQALLEEVRLQRRIELWGEGFNWFDLKRWNLPMVRNTWVSGDVNSNNIPEAYKFTAQPSDFHGWRYYIPQAGELDNNPAIDQSQLGY